MLSQLPLILTLMAATGAIGQVPGRDAADRKTYLSDIVRLCRIDWPQNRTINIICHGHSVPAGYFKTPEVHTFEAYPHLLHLGLANLFPHAVINVIVTAIGGENSEAGAHRFVTDVLSHHPDLVTIDYALNDRGIGLERARKAWITMINLAQSNGIKVVLLTPTPDLSANLDDANDPLNQHASQICALAHEYHTGLVDSLAAFKQFVREGGTLSTLMAQGNHPNKAGHAMVAKELLSWFAVDRAVNAR